MTLKLLGQRFVRQMRRFAKAIQRPLVRKIDRMLDNRVEHAVNPLFRALLMELDHLDRRLDEIQALLQERELNVEEWSGVGLESPTYVGLESPMPPDGDFPSRIAPETLHAAASGPGLPR